MPPSRESEALKASSWGWYGLPLPMVEVWTRWNESGVGSESTREVTVRVESLMLSCDIRGKATYILTFKSEIHSLRFIVTTVADLTYRQRTMIKVDAMKKIR